MPGAGGTVGVDRRRRGKTKKKMCITQFFRFGNLAWGAGHIGGRTSPSLTQFFPKLLYSLSCNRASIHNPSSRGFQLGPSQTHVTIPATVLWTSTPADTVPDFINSTNPLRNSKTPL
jgi:hypothetical protein